MAAINIRKLEDAANVFFPSSLLSMVFARFKTVLKSIKKDVTDAYKITKSTKMEHAHHLIQIVLQETFTKSALAVSRDFMLIKLQDVKPVH